VAEMAVPERVKSKIKKLGLSGVNKPKRTPGHKTKSHVVMAKEGDTYKVVRFGQQGVVGAGKKPKTKAEKMRRRLYYKRHNAQDPNPSKLSARYWSNVTKWAVILCLAASQVTA
jgi:hypothetical protein